MSVLPFPKRELSTDPVGRTIDSFESATAEVLHRERPRVERIMLYVIGGMFSLALVGSCVLKIDRIATAPGLIVPIDGTVVVAPLETAVIKTIDVKVGDNVKQGQILATLDPTFAAADLSQLQDKAVSLEAEVARLQAERDNKPFVSTGANHYQSLQGEIWLQRQAEYKASLNDFDERQRSTESSIAGLNKDIAILKSRLGLAGDIEKMRTELEKRDVGSKLNTMLAMDSRLQDEQSMSSDQANLDANQHNLESLKSQREVFLQQWQSSISTDLVQRADDLHSTNQYLQEAKLLREMVELKAPQDATVLDVAQLSVGSIAQAASTVFTLVPAGSTLVAEVQVSNLDIGAIRTKDQVKLKFDSFPFTRHGVGLGFVQTISEDSFTTLPDGSSVPPYFKARVTLTDVHLRNVPPSFRVTPGMSVEGDIIVGERTLMSYLLEGALRTGSEGMREAN